MGEGGAQIYGGREEPELRTGCSGVGDASTRVAEATGSSTPTKRRRAQFRCSDDEGSTVS
jgi:hypothetical protein